MKNMLFKSLIAMFLVITLCSLTACGGGGGGSSNSSLPPTTAKVKVSIPANLFDDANLTDVRAAVTVPTLKVRATPYLNGTYVQDSEHPAVFGEASLKDNNFITNPLDISKTYDYRFSVLFGEGANEKELLNSYVSVASITEGASFNVDIYTSYKTLAYDAWLANNPTDKSFNNFISKSAESSYKKDSDFANVVNFPYSDFKESLVKITSGQEASLPTKEAVDTEKLPATDNNPVNPDNPVDPDNPVNPDIPTDPMVVGKIGDFNLKLVTTDTGYTYDGISHNSIYKSSTAWFKGTTDSNGIPATLMFYYKSDVAEKFTSYDIMQERGDKDGGSGVIPTNIIGVSDCYAVITSYQPNKFYTKDLEDEYYGTGNYLATFTTVSCWKNGNTALLGYTDVSDPNNYGYYCDVNSASIIAGKYIAINPKSARHEAPEAMDCTYISTYTVAVYKHTTSGNGNVIANYLNYNDNYKVCRLAQASNGDCYLALTSYANNTLTIYNLDSNAPETAVVTYRITGELNRFNCLSDGSFYVETPSNRYIIRSNNDVDVSQNTSHSGCYMDDSGNIYQWYSAKNDILKTTGLNDQVTLAECKTKLNGILDLVINKDLNQKIIYVW